MSTLSLGVNARRRAELRLGLLAPIAAPMRQPPERLPEDARRLRRAAIRELQARLSTDCPATFCPPDHGPRVALAIGIHREIAARQREVPVRVLRAFLRRYTSAPAYLHLVTAGAPRVDLDGTTVAAVTEAEAAHATEKLAQLATGARPIAEGGP